MNKEPTVESPIINKGQLGIILMHALDMSYPEVQEALDYILAYCKRHGYLIVVDKAQE